LKSIRVNIHDEKTSIVREKRNSNNVSVLNNISMKGKLERKKTNIYVGQNSQVVRLRGRRSNERKPVRVVRRPH